MADLLLERQVPDRHLAVGHDPRLPVRGQVLERQDDGVELRFVVRGAALVREEDLLAGEQCDAVAVPAPVHQHVYSS